MTRILIADDLASNIYLLESLLKGNGFEVTSAKNGAEALAAAKKDPPGLIITDILMPVMDGFELCRQWKADERLRAIPFIFYTATYTDPRDEEFAHSLGAERFIVKPQKPEVLVQEVRTVLEESRVRESREPVQPPVNDQKNLQEYNEVLFRKLEKKVMQLETEIAVRKTAEAQREAMIRELEQKNAELVRFTDTVSHDLKSPLLSIRAFLGLLEDDLKTGNSERVAQDIRRISESAQKLDTLITTLLALSRSGKSVDMALPVPLTDLTREAAGLLDATLQQRGITVVFPDNLPVVKGDRQRLLQVMTNLLDNAVKFMGDQKDPRIEVNIRAGTGVPVVCVQDNGMGIRNEDLQKVFGLFERFHPDISGNGMGLATVKRIIEAHGGKIWVESEGEGKGTAVCFTLP
jgi:signal transduction histidine kinase